jgi:amidase
MTRTAAEIAAAVRAGSLTARAAAEQALARIEAADRLGAYQVVRTDSALREADEIDARTGKDDLALAGVPIAVKNNVPVTGEATRVGSAATDTAPATADHPVVQRLRAAGAVVVGLTRVPELCVFGTTDSVYGITHNPWDPARTPGGSSGGSAAAVASGTVPIALGNDGMGSIRIPSACCGLVGLKPGLGVVPSELGNGSWFGMSENGPMATTVQDAALMFAVLAGAPEFADVQPPQRLRIAMSGRHPMPGAKVDKHWAAALHETADLLRAAGHEIIERHPPYGPVMTGREIVRWTAGTELDIQDAIVDRAKLEPRTARHARAGRAFLRLGLPRERGRHKWQQRVDRALGDADVILTPGLAQPPLAAQDWAKRGWLANVMSNALAEPFCAPWNVAGWPAIAVPAGLDPRGLPLGVQLVTRPGGEARLLSLAAQLEEARPWQRVAESLAG